MKELVPKDFQLSQNYPDPFSEKTTIKYCLPEKVRIKLELIDSEKWKVKTIVDAIEEAGTYKVVLNCKDLNEGYYYYKMQAGDFIETKKMLLLK